jgi:ribosome-binding ATPase YchF (GTP1/OBG family)
LSQFSPFFFEHIAFLIRASIFICECCYRCDLFVVVIIRAWSLGVLLIGIVGKPSSGKSTFLNAACRTAAKVGAYPFTTIEPNPGTAYVRVDCICQEFEVDCNAKNSVCREGVRLIPIDMLDVAGLVPDAHKGRGRGNKFLDDLRRADAFIHVVDSSGSLDAEGRDVEPGSWDPKQDVEFLEREICMWLVQILQRDWRRLSRRAETEKLSISTLLAEKLSGLQIIEITIKEALRDAQLQTDKPAEWTDEELEAFVEKLRLRAKPMVIAANKIDRTQAAQYFESLSQLTDETVIPCSAAGELALRNLSEKGIISYQPGADKFEILQSEKLGEAEQNQLQRLQTEILDKYGSTEMQVNSVIMMGTSFLMSIWFHREPQPVNSHIKFIQILVIPSFMHLMQGRRNDSLKTMSSNPMMSSGLLQQVPLTRC